MPMPGEKLRAQLRAECSSKNKKGRRGGGSRGVTHNCVGGPARQRPEPSLLVSSEPARPSPPPTQGGQRC